MKKMNKISDILPEKGKDIIGIDDIGTKYYCFRCNCGNSNCLEWKCSLTGFGLLINVVEWEYDNLKE